MSFAERTVSADGFEIRYLEDGDGPPLVCLHGAGGLRLSRAHELLAATRRVIAFEIPGFGASPANERSASLRELAATIVAAADALGLEGFDLWGTSFGGKLALWLAVDAPQRLGALVLAAPAAIRQPGVRPPENPAELAAILYHHPERLTLSPRTPPPSPEVAAKQRALVQRLIGPPRDAELEAAMRELAVPTLVMFGTEDRLTPPELGRHYPELLPDGHLVLIYDAAHALDADRPEAFAALVSDFLEQRGQFVVRRTSGLLYP
jgi:pimeloyl-ACP methyl ester carboxylesterase